jgi:hypothetical protein
MNPIYHSLHVSLYQPGVLTEPESEIHVIHYALIWHHFFLRHENLDNWPNAGGSSLRRKGGLVWLSRPLVLRSSS